MKLSDLFSSVSFEDFRNKSVRLKKSPLGKSHATEGNLLGIGCEMPNGEIEIQGIDGTFIKDAAYAIKNPDAFTGFGMLIIHN